MRKATLILALALTAAPLFAASSGRSQSYFTYDDGGTVIRQAEDGRDIDARVNLPVFPGDEVTTVVVNGDVHVVVPGCPIAAQEMLNTVLRRNPRRVLIAYECDPGGSFDDWPAVVGGCPRIAVGIGVHAHGGFNDIIHPENHGVREKTFSY